MTQKYLLLSAAAAATVGSAKAGGALRGLLDDSKAATANTEANTRDLWWHVPHGHNPHVHLNNNWPCVHDSMCKSGRCRVVCLAKAGYGEFCAFDADCARDQDYCIGRGSNSKCQPKLDAGENCHIDASCKNNDCRGGRCGGAKTGEFCVLDSQCTSGLVCTFKDSIFQSCQSEYAQCLERCATKDLLGFKVAEDCIDCLRRDHGFILGEAQIPGGAIADLLQAKLGVGYTEMWCGKDDLPSGWHADGSGGYTGCETTEDFPGDHTTSHQSYDYVKAQMKTLPALQNSGQVWRGNELGFIISNERYWDGRGISPRTVLLGASPKQHKVLRPILMELFSTCDAKCEEHLRDTTKQLLGGSSLAVQQDVKEFVFHRLFEIAFPGESNPINAADFVKTQSSFTTLSTLTQMVSDGLGDLIETVTKTNEQLVGYFDKLLPLVQKHYSARLAPYDCSPSASCEHQLASALLDTLLAAGGLSVPGGISTGLWVLYGNVADANKNEKFKDVFPENYKLQHGGMNEVNFFYESIRFFAPVVGFPWWEKAPARATDDYASQYEGGVRKVLNLALANKDPNAWGPNAHKFEVRAHNTYANKFVGFADFAVDSSVANGAMDRKCPGKTLALSMGKIFFQEFDQDAWCAEDGAASKYSEATPFFDDFVLKRC